MNAPTWFKPEDRPSPACDDPTINRVELVGYVGQEPEQRRTSQQELIVSFGLATHRLLQSSDGDTRQLTDSHRVIADGAVAMAVADLRRGALVEVVGRLRTRSWETRRGERRMRTEVIAAEVRTVRRAPLFRQASLPLGYPGRDPGLRDGPPRVLELEAS